MSEHGHLSEYLRTLKELDRMTVTVTLSLAARPAVSPVSDADFDRRVRKSMDRLHRRAVIGHG